MKKIFISILCLASLACASRPAICEDVDYQAMIAEIKQQDAKIQKEAQELNNKLQTLQQQILINLGARNQLEVLVQLQENKKVKK